MSRFIFKYNKREYSFTADSVHSTDLWIECLRFLQELAVRSETTSTSEQMAKKYFESLPTFKVILKEFLNKEEENN